MEEQLPLTVGKAPRNLTAMGKKELFHYKSEPRAQDFTYSAACSVLFPSDQRLGPQKKHQTRQTTVAKKCRKACRKANNLTTLSDQA